MNNKQFKEPALIPQDIPELHRVQQRLDGALTDLENSLRVISDQLTAITGQNTVSPDIPVNGAYEPMMPSFISDMYRSLERLDGIVVGVDSFKNTLSRLIGC